MIYLFLANGFEEIEALCPLDLLRRAGLPVKTVAVGTEDCLVTGAHGIPVTADMHERDLCDKAPTMVILPGGMPGAKNLDASPTVERVLAETKTAGGYLAAICAAPMILGKRDYLVGKRAICFPGFEKDLHGATVADTRVVRDGNIITAAGMGVALPFGLALVEALTDAETAGKLKKSVLAD